MRYLLEGIAEFCLYLDYHHESFGRVTGCCHADFDDVFELMSEMRYQEGSQGKELDDDKSSIGAKQISDKNMLSMH